MCGYGYKNGFNFNVDLYVGGVGNPIAFCLLLLIMSNIYQNYLSAQFCPHLPTGGLRN